MKWTLEMVVAFALYIVVVIALMIYGHRHPEDTSVEACDMDFWDDND